MAADPGDDDEHELLDADQLVAGPSPSGTEPVDPDQQRNQA